MDTNSYHKLQPPVPPPEDEICSCPGAPPIKMMHALGYNPLHCLDCNLEVLTERLQLISEMVDTIAFWRSTYDAIYMLWLQSGLYEEWAIAQLSDISSAVNVEGRAVQRALDGLHRCYYWYFVDQTAYDYVPLTACPSCGAAMRLYSGGIFPQSICDRCSIVVVA